MPAHSSHDGGALNIRPPPQGRGFLQVDVPARELERWSRPSCSVSATSLSRAPETCQHRGRNGQSLCVMVAANLPSMLMVSHRRFCPATARGRNSNTVVWARLLPAVNGRASAAEIGNEGSDHRGSMRMSIVGQSSLQTQPLYHRIAIARPYDADEARAFPPPTATGLLVGVPGTDAGHRRGEIRHCKTLLIIHSVQRLSFDQAKVGAFRRSLT